MHDQELVGSELTVKDDGLLPNFTSLETKILEGAIQGTSIYRLSIQLKIPQTFIRTFLSKNHVKKFLKEQNEVAAQNVQLKLQGLLSEILEERLEEVEGDLSKLTNKDTLEVMKLLNDIASGVAKQSAQSEETDKYAAILEKVLR